MTEHVLSTKSFLIVAEIKARWVNITNTVCSDCMCAALYHYNRTMDFACDDQGEAHPNSSDGKIYAHAGTDIHRLLNIIDQLTGQI